MLCPISRTSGSGTECKDLISKSAQLSLVNICVSFLLSTPMLLFSWTESELLPLDEMFADCQLGLSQHSAYYRIVKHTKCRPTTPVTPDSHRTHPDSHYNPHLHRCWPHASLKVVNCPYLYKYFFQLKWIAFP